MVLFQMITSFFQKPVVVLSLHGSTGSLDYVILPVRMQIIVWLVFYLVKGFLKKRPE